MRLKTKRQKCCKFPQKSTNNRDNYLTLSHNSKRQSSVDVKKFGSIPTSNRSGRRNRPTSSRIHQSLEPRFNSPTSSGHHQTKQHHNRVTTWTRQESYGAHPTDKGAPQAKRTGKFKITESIAELSDKLVGLNITAPGEPKPIKASSGPYYVFKTQEPY
ncbi:unnamed protein product [Rhodiola kirilowii]